MTDFDALLNKVPANGAPLSAPWPELGAACCINRFYCEFDSASGFIGAGYFEIWPRDFLATAQAGAEIAYPSSFRFFASDGGGNMFGATARDGRTVYLSAPNIGGVEDVRYFETWSDLLLAIAAGDYV